MNRLTDLSSDFLASEEALVLLPKSIDFPQNSGIKPGSAIIAKKVLRIHQQKGPNGNPPDKYLIGIIEPEETAIEGRNCSFDTKNSYLHRLRMCLQGLISNPLVNLNSLTTNVQSPKSKRLLTNIFTQAQFDSYFDAIAIISPESLAWLDQDTPKPKQETKTLDTEEDSLSKSLMGLEVNGKQKLKNWL
jgi:hypothetical protein